jgi:hypothetical protein
MTRFEKKPPSLADDILKVWQAAEDKKFSAAGEIFHYEKDSFSFIVFNKIEYADYPRVGYALCNDNFSLEVFKNYILAGQVMIEDFQRHTLPYKLIL